MINHNVIYIMFMCGVSHHSKDLKQQTSVTAWLQLRVLFSKQRIVHLQSVRVGRPQRRGLNPSCHPLFIHFVSTPHPRCPPSNPEPALCKLGLARKGACLFYLRFLLWSSDLSFIPFFVGFSLSLSFSYCHFGLLSLF